MMGTRTKHVNLKRLAEIHESARNNKRIVVAHASQTHQAVINAVVAHEIDTRQAVIDALPGDYWRGYEACVKRKPDGGVSSAMIAADLVVSQTYASTMLKDMHEMGLLQRKQESGSRYIYWVNEE